MSAQHTQGLYVNGKPLHSIPPGRWLVYTKGDVQVGTLTYTENDNVRGWRFFPADQGTPSRRYWPNPYGAIPRRFGHADRLAAVDDYMARAAIARAEGGASAQQPTHPAPAEKAAP